MGRQIRFFFDKEDELLFTDYIYENNFLVMDVKANILTKADMIASNDLSFYLTSADSRIDKRGEFIDQITSEVIVYSREKIWNDGMLKPGRLWVELKYWNSSEEHVPKNNQLGQSYNTLKKWIIKNTRISTCKNYYIGKYAYNLYEQSGWKMSAGPKYFAEFK